MPITDSHKLLWKDVAKMFDDHYITMPHFTVLYDPAAPRPKPPRFWRLRAPFYEASYRIGYAWRVLRHGVPMEW